MKKKLWLLPAVYSLEERIIGPSYLQVLYILLNATGVTNHPPL